MKESIFAMDDEDDKESFVLKEVLFRYLPYWPWFLAVTLFSLFIGYLVMRYAPTKYVSIAKIKIIDDSKELDITTDPTALLNGSSKINLDNEIEVLKSYRLLGQVVNDLNLDVSYYEVGNFRTSEIGDAPFVVTKTVPKDSIEKPLVYKVKLQDDGILITDQEDKRFTLPPDSSNKPNDILPFNINLTESVKLDDFEDINYKIVINPFKETVFKLTDELQVQTTNKKSEILSLSMVGESSERSETILNATIARFNQDGILDRQLVSKRTMDFIDERFIYLSEELDSIESGKQDFKQENNLSYIEEDATITLQKKSENEQEVFKLQTQISISNLLKETIENEKAYSLLPSDIGLENSSVNNLVSDYNTLVLEREKLMTMVGESHPTLQVLNSQLERGKQNILNTVGIYQKQLKMSLTQRNEEKEVAGSMFSRLPEKEKMLRAIERQQSIKENLFLLLLQKREEAAINFAVTAPSVKVVDFGLTNNKPISPKSTMVYPVALLLGLVVPFGVLFIGFYLDTKVHDRFNLEKLNPEIPVLVEIPVLEDEKIMQTHDRSILAESFRILSTNINFLLAKKNVENEGRVIFVTSTIKGEGKTLIAVNSSLAYASLSKKVLLLGADLRNPQLHNYIDYDKNSIGLSDYLKNPLKTDWRDGLMDFRSNPNHKVMFSGPIPPNAPELLSSTIFSKFINEVKKEFDYIIVDTAPTLLVTDTLLIAENADITLFVTRANFTEKRLLKFSKDLNKTKKLNNMAYVVNSVDRNNFKGYNYGYGYGYDDQKTQKSWYKEGFENIKDTVLNLFRRLKTVVSERDNRS